MQIRGDEAVRFACCVCVPSHHHRHHYHHYNLLYRYISCSYTKFDGKLKVGAFVGCTNNVVEAKPFLVGLLVISLIINRKSELLIPSG